jgi:hypothetical protein
MEKAGTLGLTEPLGSAVGPMVAATFSMRHAQSTQKQNGENRRRQGHLTFQRKRATNAEKLARNSILNATNARPRTARFVKKKLTRKDLTKEDRHATAWRAFQRWRGKSIGACASNAEKLARNSLLNASTAKPHTARDVKIKLARKVLKKEDHHASD